MPRIKINELEMYYELYGEGQPIVLVAGFGSDHKVWKTVTDLLSRNYKVLVFDNRGAGQTEVSDGQYSIEQLANDVFLLCEGLEIKKAHFIGSSMGGFVVQMLAYKYPDLVQSAIICNSGSIMHNCFRYFLLAQYHLKKANVATEAVLMAFYCWIFSFKILSQDGFIENLIARNLTKKYPFTSEGYQAQYYAIENFDSRAWINKIKVPILFIGADQDLIFSELSVSLLAAEIPGAQYYCFKECGHLPHFEQPLEFSAVVLNFIGSLKH